MKAWADRGRSYRGRRAFAALALLILLHAPVAPAAEAFMSREGLFRLRYQPETGTIPLNKMHAWTVHIETAAGDPVDDARIVVEGGMPAHNHGLPTQPRQTRSLGNGDYLVEGLRFHMAGAWEMRLEIRAGGRADTVVVPLRL